MAVMAKDAVARTKTKRSETTAVNNRGSQSMCACGSSKIASGECAHCGKTGAGYPFEHPPVESRFGQDFSWVPAHAKAPAELQAKLTVNRSVNPYEREAEAVAETLMRMTDQFAPRVPLQMGPRGMIHRSADAAMGAAPPTVDDLLRTPGRPLDADIRAFMEPRFGHDFSQVRVHSDAAAERSARDVSSRAYTVGHHIAFGSGQFAPRTYEGRRLLAHELTHVVQQSGTPGPAARSSVGPALRIDASAPVQIARQQSEAKPSAESKGAAVEDKWKGTPVSEIIISIARQRVGFRVPQGMLLGKVKTDLVPGRYELKPMRAAHVWTIVEKPGLQPALGFTADLSESSADQWTLSYPDTIVPLTVVPGEIVEPKTFADMTDEKGKLKDPLSVYDAPLQPPSGIDDYETIGLVKETVAPPNSKVQATPPRYRVKYRNNTERLLTYTELTPQMRAHLRPIFEKADANFLMFTIETFPSWWSIVSATPLAPMRGAGARPYAPRRIPLAPTEFQAFTQARSARNTMVAQYNTMPKSQRESIAAVTGGVNIETGEIAGGYSTAGGCAEDMVTARLGGDPSKIRFSEAIRPRTGQQQPVCQRCQGKYLPSQFPEGVIFDGVGGRMPGSGE